MCRLSSRRPALLFVAGIVSALGACSGDTNLVRDAAVWSGVGAERKPAPDFVVQSRSGATDYVPVGAAAPARAVNAKPKPGVKAAEAEMDAVRARNDARANEARQIGAAVPAAEVPVVSPAPRP